MYIPLDFNTKVPKGFCFVEYKDDGASLAPFALFAGARARRRVARASGLTRGGVSGDADKAIQEMDGKLLGGRKIQVLR